MASKKRGGGGDGGGGAALLETLGDFTNKENWDKFFIERGAGDAFEWYAELEPLTAPLFSHLPDPTAAADFQILVPGCGSSRLSEHVYDAGFRHITNIDFSKVVVADMLRRNIRKRPEMKWRVMDMTEMQFADELFDAILDKGALDALLEPEVGPVLGSNYLKEVQRVLKSGGKFLCVTLAESHVLGLLFSVFRFGWKTSIQAIPQKPSDRTTFQTFMVTLVKENLAGVSQLISLFDCSTVVSSNTNQILALVDAVENENNIRNGIYKVKDLSLGTKGNLKQLQPGLRCRLVLGEPGSSLYSYKAVLLDSTEKSNSFLYHYGVFLVPKTRAHEWLFSSEEGQWLVVESSRAARLTMVFIDSRHSHASLDDIKKDLSPLVKALAPGENDDETLIPFLTAGEETKQRTIVKQVTSGITGLITVDDVIYKNTDNDEANIISSDDKLIGKGSQGSESKIFRRLVFGRSSGLVQSEVSLTREEFEMLEDGDRKRNNASSKSHKKGGRKQSNSHRSISGLKSSLKVDHSCMASDYHNGIIYGLSLIASNMENAVSLQKQIRTVIIGLGAGILPMFLRGCLHVLDVEVVELDPTVLDLAKDYFGFKEDEQLKVHIGDGIKFLQEDKSNKSSNVILQNESDDSSRSRQTSNGKCLSLADGNSQSGLKILIVDADSSDLSSGLSCPPAEFVEEPFLQIVKEFLSEGGLFVVNLVSRSPDIRNTVVSRMKKVFNLLYSLELEEDVNEVIFASSIEERIGVDQFPQAIAQLQSLLKFPLPEKVMSKFKLTCLE